MRRISKKISEAESNCDAWLQRKQRALEKIAPLHEKGIFLDGFVEVWSYSVKMESGIPAIRGEQGLNFILNSSLEEIEAAFNKSEKERLL